MPPPSTLWDEAAALEQVQAFVRAACPEVDPRNVYRGRPSATPGAFGPVTILLLPLTPVPALDSPLGAESDGKQRQRWTVTVTAAAEGDWTIRALGAESAPFAAGPGDGVAAVAAGLRAALDALALPLATEALPAPPPGAFSVLGDEAGASLGVSVSAPAGGAISLAVVDDCVRRASYNWGRWRVRLIFRDVPASSAGPATATRYSAATLCDRVRLWLQASSLPATNGLAYPYRRDQLAAAAGRLSWCGTTILPTQDEQQNGAWVRVAAIDVEFQTPVALLHDVPSLDAMGLASLSI